MNKHYLSVPVGTEEVRLRLTMAGQKALCAQFDTDILSILFDCATAPEKLCALLTQGLRWPDSGNSITDGDALYDRLVDDGRSGGAEFAALAFRLGAVSGLLTEQQAEELTHSVTNAYEAAFAALTRNDRAD